MVSEFIAMRPPFLWKIVDECNNYDEDCLSDLHEDVCKQLNCCLQKIALSIVENSITMLEAARRNLNQIRTIVTLTGTCHPQFHLVIIYTQQ